MFQSLGIMLLRLTCCALSAQHVSAQNNNQDHRVRNIVLVHGAWADGSGWKGVYDILVHDGFNVSVNQSGDAEPGGGALLQQAGDSGAVDQRRQAGGQDDPALLSPFSF